jgi:spermidine dehydrogenase
MYMIAPPTKPHTGLAPRDQYRIAGAKLLTKQFSSFEFEIREHLQGLFEETGFSSANDIVSLTVNRWGHGYSYELNSLYDPAFAAGELPYEVARKPFGSIAIANTDSAMAPHAPDAIEQAARAINELTTA